MNASEWLLIAIGVAQAIALAVAAIFAWKAYALAKQERKAAEVARQASEARRLLQAVIDETKELAHVLEERVQASGAQRHDLIAGQQERLKLALGFFPQELFPRTRALTSLPANELRREAVEAAGGELAGAALQLAPASFGPLLGPGAERI
jgi:hypothetical protein